MRVLLHFQAVSISLGIMALVAGFSEVADRPPVRLFATQADETPVPAGSTESPDTTELVPGLETSPPDPLLSPGAEEGAPEEVPIATPTATPARSGGGGRVLGTPTPVILALPTRAAPGNGPFLADYGDAPDNTGGPDRRAGYRFPFDRAPARFPSLHDSVNCRISSFKAAHEIDNTITWLGRERSRERNANDPADPDGRPNLAPFDTDAFDDSEPVFFFSRRVPLSGAAEVVTDGVEVMVTVAPGAPVAPTPVVIGGLEGTLVPRLRTPLFLNVLVDRDHNGAWDNAHEWVVRNFAFLQEPGTSARVAAPASVPLSGSPPSDSWVRIMLSIAPIDPTPFGSQGWDGCLSLSDGSDAAGEVEDYLFVDGEPSQPPPRPDSDTPGSFQAPPVSTPFNATPRPTPLPTATPAPTPLLAGQTLILLARNASPRDVDPHLWVPTSRGLSHVFFGAPNGDKGASATRASLSEADDSITIFANNEGTYTYALHNFSNEAPLSASGARIRVLRGSLDISSFLVPSGNGRWWCVFTMNGATGAIAPIASPNGIIVPSTAPFDSPSSPCP